MAIFYQAPKQVIDNKNMVPHSTPVERYRVADSKLADSKPNLVRRISRAVAKLASVFDIGLLCDPLSRSLDA